VRDTGGLATPLRDGAELFVIPAVSGGSHGRDWGAVKR
jgi:molybdopterin converting factor small subunit